MPGRGSAQLRFDLGSEDSKISRLKHTPIGPVVTCLGHETCVFPCPALVVLFINSSNVTSPLSSFDLVVMLGFALCVLTEIVSDIQKLGWNFVVGKGSSP